MGSIFSNPLYKYTTNKETSMNKAHLDTTIKGCAVGLLTYLGVQQGWSAEIVAVLVPIASVALSWASTKFGDKNVAMFLSVAEKYIMDDKSVSAAVAVKAAPKKKKAPAKKAK